MNKPKNFDQYVGNKKLVSFLTNRIIDDTFPEATLLVGEEGLGKTSLAKLLAKSITCTDTEVNMCCKCENCEQADQNIDTNKSTEFIKVYKMSEDGGIEAAKEVIQELQVGFLKEDQKKVVILDEVHAMSSGAQNALLAVLEHIPKNIKLIALTTNSLGLQKDFKSRFVEFRIKRLTDDELLSLLINTVSNRNITIQGGVNALKRIVPYAENKPRAALKILDAVGVNANITSEDLAILIGDEDIIRYHEILQCLNGSIYEGLHKIFELNVTPLTQTMLLRACKKCMEDFAVEETSLFTFMYSIGNKENLTLENIVSSFILAHKNGKIFGHEGNEEVIQDEKLFLERKLGKAVIENRGIVDTPPTMESLIFGGVSLRSK